MNPLINMLMRSKNPYSLLQQLSQNNPKLQRVMEILNGKSPKELEQFVRNTAQTQGVNLKELAQKIGLQLPQ